MAKKSSGNKSRTTKKVKIGLSKQKQKNIVKRGSGSGNRPSKKANN